MNDTIKYPIVKKAYRLKLEYLDEGYMSDEKVVFAETLNKAKVAILKIIKYDGWQLKWKSEEINYLTIPVERDKKCDLLLFEGKELNAFQIQQELREQERGAGFENILADESIKFCYIKKGPYYRPNSAGYTDHKIFAGVYTKEYAVSHARGVREISVIPIDIEKHNNMILDEVADLKTRLISPIK